MRVLKTPPHFHFHFVHERLVIANLFFDFSRPTEERAKFPGPPANKGRLVFAFKMMPAKARAFQPRHGARATCGRFLSQWPLIDQDKAAGRFVSRSGRWFSRFLLSRHRPNLRSRRDRPSLSLPR